jgi:hypothetical protein
MKKNILLAAAIVSLLSLSLTSCFKDLDLQPEYGLNSETVYKDPDNYIHVLAKLYAGLTMTGNRGPAGAADISGIDEGFSQYVRVLWNLQELPTDEAICGWNDPGMPEMNKMTWSSDNPWVKGMYYRIYFEVALCNEFIRESSDAKMAERGFSDADKDRIRMYRAEARFLRAMAYYHLMDLYGKGPFVTENDNVGSFYPREIRTVELFNYVSAELREIEGQMGEPRFQYGRADKAAVWTLLSRLYLNQKVYTPNKVGFDSCAYYCDLVLNAGYQLETNYRDLFLSDNHNSQEIIFPVICDGLNTQSYGGTTFLVHASIGGSMVPLQYGVATGWAGLRAKRNLVDVLDTTDDRYYFHTAGQTLDINIMTTFTNGYGVKKWRNVDRNGNIGSDPTKTFVDTDFPMFRLADVYLMRAEAKFELGMHSDARTDINTVRTRAHAAPLTNLPTREDILAERMRELYWEGTRRTDLIRFEKYTTSTYVWPFKGGPQAGTGVSDHLKLYPIPGSDLAANPNLTQNPGY